MKLINISYRLPVSFKSKNGKIEIKTSNGGLVSALQSIKNNEELHWFGVADFTRAEFTGGINLYKGEFKLHPVYLDNDINYGFYSGFSNAVLWPLFHYFPSFVDFILSHYNAYIKANQLIADQVCESLTDKDTVWIHDYQLLPLAEMIRAQKPDVKIGFFLHIPFPNYELLRLLPKYCRNTIVKGMLGADLIGFHTYEYARHFIDTVQMIEGMQHKQYNFKYQNRNVRIGIFPIGIDFSKYNDAYSLPLIAQEREKILALYEGKKIIFSVDRLDYTKGIVYRLKGYEEFLKNNPEYQEKIIFILLAVPSRNTIKKYIERKQMIEMLISDINGRLGNTKWTPIVYQYSSVNFTELLGLYTSCDIALISPLRDGMNLVAKEFAASRKDLDGVLLLSDMTGAAKELTDALLFNPLDAKEIGTKINVALQMPIDERKERMQNMQQQIKKNDVVAWGGNFIKTLNESVSNNTIPKLLDFESKRDLLINYQNAKKRILFIDYDGTLSNFYPTPQEAAPQDSVIELLRNLSAILKNTVVLVSGRDKETLENWFGHLPIHLIAEHGLFIKSKEWESTLYDKPLWLDNVAHIVENFVDNCAGSFIEKKSYSICWHYRNCETEKGFAHSRELIALLSQYLTNSNATIIDGNKVIEIKPAHINKGTGIYTFLKSQQYEFCMALGDDRTDEDMFEVVNKFNGYSIKVGKGNSTAGYRLETVQMVLSFLSQINV